MTRKSWSIFRQSDECSIAPYLTSTHDCFYHIPHGPAWELSNADIQVKITDEATGEVLVDEATTTFDNGFGFWLPDDVTGLIEVSYQGKKRHHGVFHHRRRCHLCHRPAPHVMAQQSPHLRLSPVSLKSYTRKVKS